MVIRQPGYHSPEPTRELLFRVRAQKDMASFKTGEVLDVVRFVSGDEESSEWQVVANGHEVRIYISSRQNIALLLSLSRERYGIPLQTLR